MLLNPFISFSVAIPATPTGLASVPGDTVADLSWGASVGATGYNLYRDGVGFAVGNVTTFHDDGLSNGVTYSYTISATNAGGESAQSGAVTATPEWQPSAAGTVVTRIRASTFGLSDGDLISTGSDSSSGGNPVTAAGAARPTYKTGANGMNGKAVMRFAGSQYLQVAAFSGGAATQPVTVGLVFRPTSGAGFHVLLDGGDASDRLLAYVNSNFAGASGNFVAASAGPIESFGHTMILVLNGASSKIYLGGRQVAAGNFGAFNLNGLTIGAAYDGTVGMVGDVAEVIVWAGDIDTDGRAAFNAYSVAEYKPTGGYTIVDSTLSGEGIRVMIPDAPVAGTAIMYCHGTGETEASITDSVSSDKCLHVLNALARGQIVAASNGAGSGWNNNAAQLAYTQLAAHLVSTYAVNTIAFLAQSMGGESALFHLSQGLTGLTIEGFYGIYPSCDLDDAHGNVSLSSSVNTAYGGNYAANSPGHNPLGLAAATFDGKVMTFLASPDDSIVPKVANTDAFVTKVTGHAASATVVTTSGEHGDVSNFVIAPWLTFLDDCF